MNRILRWLLPYLCPVCNHRFRKPGYHICAVRNVCELCAREIQGNH